MSTFEEASRDLCWTAIRSIMLAFSEKWIRDIATKHPKQEFYCVSVYFDAVYGNFIVYLNDPEQAKATAVELKAKFPEQYRGQTLEQVIDSFKWNPGNFRYMLEGDELWGAAWGPIAELFDRLNMELFEEAKRKKTKKAQADYEEFSRRAMETACHVAIDLERSATVKLLKKTKDFRVTCVDHDETQETSDERLANARKTYKPL